MVAFSVAEKAPMVVVPSLLTVGAIGVIVSVPVAEPV